LKWKNLITIFLLLNIGAMISPSWQDLKNVWFLMIILIFIPSDLSSSSTSFTPFLGGSIKAISPSNLRSDSSLTVYFCSIGNILVAIAKTL